MEAVAEVTLSWPISQPQGAQGQALQAGCEDFLRAAAAAAAAPAVFGLCGNFVVVLQDVQDGLVHVEGREIVNADFDGTVANGVASTHACHVKPLLQAHGSGTLCAFALAAEACAATAVLVARLVVALDSVDLAVDCFADSFPDVARVRTVRPVAF